MKTIAFDIDGTWTLMPDVFRSIWNALTSIGCRCIIVTGAPQPSEKLTRLHIPSDATIIIAEGVFKKTAAEKAGHTVDVWIDDMPGTIEPARILSDNLDDGLLEWMEDHASRLESVDHPNCDAGDYSTTWTVYECEDAIGFGETPSKAIQDAMKGPDDPSKWDYIPPEFRDSNH